jgi:hypothetical protein
VCIVVEISLADLDYFFYSDPYLTFHFDAAPDPDPTLLMFEVIKKIITGVGADVKF